MLKEIRKRGHNKTTWIILSIFILPPFLFWGFGSMMKGKQEAQYVGKIFGKKISLSDYKDSFEATKNQAIIQFGDKLSEVQKYLDLESQAWDRLILLAEAKKRKIKVSDKELIELIKNYPFFQNKGKFSEQIYAQLLRYAFRTPARVFEEQTRQNLMLAKLYQQLTDKISVTDEEVKKEYEKTNEQLSIYYISSNPADFEKEITTTEEQLKDYFTKNQLKFKRPLSFNVEYIALPYEEKEETQLKEKIKNLMSKLDKKEDFIKTARDENLEVKESGLFSQGDPIPGIGWAPQIINLVSNLKIGQHLQPIRIDKSYYILRLKDKKDPHIPEFQTIKDKIKETLIKEKAKNIAQDKINSCLKTLKEQIELLKSSIDFDKQARIAGLKSSATELFKYGTYLEGIGASDTLFLEAQKLKDNQISEVIEMPSGFYIIKLKSRVPVDPKKFEEEKAEFKTRLLSQKKQEQFMQFTQELKQKAQ